MRPLILAVLMVCACSDGSGPGDEPDPFRQVSVGEYNACAVVESGAGYCWGGLRDDSPGSGRVPARYGGDRSSTSCPRRSGASGNTSAA